MTSALPSGPPRLTLRGIVKRYPSVGERNIYSVPGDWGECGVYVRGAPGTQFSFQEYPASYNPPLLPLQ